MDFSSPVVGAAAIGAVVAIIGTIVTALGSRRHDKAETALNALSVLTDKHADRVQTLEAKVDAQAQRIDQLAAEIDEIRKEKRHLQEKYSVSLTYVSQLWLMWGGVSIPPVPHLIAADLHHGEQVTEQVRDPPNT